MGSAVSLGLRVDQRSAYRVTLPMEALPTLEACEGHVESIDALASAITAACSTVAGVLFAAAVV